VASKHAKVDLIKSVSLFEGLRRGEIEEIAQLVDEIEVPAGKVLMRQGETGNEMFVIASGRFEVERDGRVINTLGPGSAIGELSMIAEGPRTATVRALEPSKLLVAGHREFHSLMDGHPAIRMRILEGLARKIRALDESRLH
jgi:CRP-like cAMP-binding protein